MDSVREPGEALEAEATWGGRQVALGIGVAFAWFFLAVLAVVWPFSSRFGQESVESFAAQVITVPIWDIGIILIAFKLAGGESHTWRQLGLRRASVTPPEWYIAVRRQLRSLSGFSVSWPVWLVITGFLTSMVAVQAYVLVVSVLDLGALEPSEQVPSGFFDNDWLIPFLGLSVVITAPISEEIFFRGFVFSGLRRIWGLWPGAIASGLFFSLAHGNLGLVIPFTLIGAILASSYHRSGTIATPVAIHFLFNSVGFLVLVFVPGAR